MSILNLFRRKKVKDHTAQRARLLSQGRITEGRIIDITTDSDGAVTHIFYTYQANGVDYESSQMLDVQQRQHLADYVLGTSVIVRFDPRQPGNSIVV